MKHLGQVPLRLAVFSATDEAQKGRNGDIKMNTETATETTADRLNRLQVTPATEKRVESLTVANAAGVTDEVFREIATALRVKRDSESIVLPPHRYENLSRGRGWARLGKGARVTWGERVDGGYEVGPGCWDVGASDGFSRKDSATWTVKHVTVGGATWTIAN